MAIKFLSGLNLSNVTAGSILKLDSNGNIVAATAGTDYATSNLWSTAGQGGVNINKDVRIGTYSSDVLPEARLHVYEYQTTDPKLLIEDGNTGDASMQFKISTQSYTMGIDNSDSDNFVLAASTALGTTNAIEVSTTGVTQFGNDIKLSNGWTLTTASTSYAKFGSWVNVEGTGLYTTSDILMDLDDSSSRFVIRGLNNTEHFIANTATNKISIPTWSFEANDITQTASGDNWSSTTSVEYNQTGVKLSRSSSGYVSAAPYKLIGSFTASVSFKTSNTTHLGIIFAASETNQDNDNYAVILRNNGSNGTEVRVQKRLNSAQSYPIGAVNVTSDCDDGNWHELTVSYNGKHIVVDIDGTNYFNQAWTDTSFTSPGLVGLAIYDGTCQFNDLQVTETPSTTTFENLNLSNGNRTLDVKLATTPTTGDVGVQLRAGSGDYLGLAAGGGTGIGLVVDSSNNVGIGTTSPGSLLSVRATSASHQLVRINRPNSDTAALYLGNNSSNDAIISGNNAPISLGKDVSGTYTEYVNIATDGELKFSAYTAGILKTNASGIVSVDTSTYVTDVDWNDISSVQDSIDLNSTVQISQGDTETIVSFQNSGTERGRFEVDDSANSYFVATGFKTSTASTGFLKADGTVDTGDFFGGAYSDLTGTPTLGTMAAAATSDYKTSDATETYVATELGSYTTTSSFGTNAFTSFSDHSTQGYLTSYTEADTLDSVTGRGATTTNNISVGNLSASKLEVLGSGGTVLDIQGSVGQLFSVTDSLTGDLFAVSDISGIPILNVNSSGAVDIDGTLNLGDSDKIQLGASQDLQIFHNGSNSHIETSSTSTGDFFVTARGTNHDLYLEAADNIYIRPQGNENGVVVVGNGGVTLYYNNVAKLETYATGAGVTGSFYLASGNYVHFDNGVTNNYAIRKSSANLEFKTGGGYNFLSGNATFAGSITTNLSSEGTYFTGGSGGVRQLSITSGTNTSAHALHTFNIASSNGKYEFDVNGTTELSLDSSSATFAGTIGATNFSGSSSGTNTGDQDLSGYSTASGVEDNADVTDTANVVAALTAGTNVSIAANGTISATDTNYYLDGIERTDGTNTLAFSVSGATNQSFTFGANAFNSTTIPAAEAYTAHEDTSTLSGVYGDTANGTKIDTITVDANGHITAIATGATGNMTGFFVEDGDGTEVQINNANEWKFVEGTGIDINWTDTNQGIDSDPYDLTFSLKNNSVSATQLNVSGNGTSGQVLTSDGDGTFSWSAKTANTDTITSVGVSGSETSGTITLSDAGATTITQSGGGIEIRSTDTQYNDATTSTAGLMSTTDKSKLDGIASSANNYSLPANIPATSVAIGSTVTLSESADRADLLYINSSTSNWGGLQIGNTSNEFIFSLMGNDNSGGIYDDQNGDWIIYWQENAGVEIKHNSSTKLTTTSTGITITGEIVTTGGNSTNWNTAYGWGDHGSAGYLTAETFSATDTVMSLSGTDVTAGESITLAGGLSYSGTTLTSANDNTTYTAGTGLTLTNTTFSVTANTYATAAQGTTADAALPKAGGTLTGHLTLSNTNAPSNLAELNIGSSGGGETRAIDIIGGWSANESKSISFTHGSAAANMVAQINVLYTGSSSKIRWGKFYHGGDSSTYTMELLSTSLTTANLTVSGNIAATNFSGSSSGTNTGDQDLSGYAPLASPALTGTPTAPTAAAATNTTQLATTAFVSTAIANLSDSAPATLDTLNELAAALGDDANFSTTVTNSIATKLPLAGGTMTGDLIIGTAASAGLTQAFGNFDQLKFDNSHSDSARGPNKIVMHDNGAAWRGGFGIHSATVAYYSGDKHIWYKSGSSDSYTERMTLDGSGNLSIDGTLSASGYNKSDWDTAYGWGDHGDEGYLTAETFGSSDVVLSLSGTDVIAGDSITLAGGLSYNASTKTLSQTDNNTVYTHPTSAGNKHIPTGGAAGQFLRYSSSGTATWATPSYTTNTDTVYVHPTSAGNKHIPTGGSAGQFLKYSSSGTAVWAAPSYTTNTDTQLSDSYVRGLYTGGSNVSITAAGVISSTNTTYSTADFDAAGSADAVQSNLDSIAANVAGISNQSNTDVDTGTETIAQVAKGTYTAAFFDFVIKNGTNVRAGTVYSCHDGTNVEFTETSTVDLGDTSDVSLSVDISGTNMRLRATTTSNNWSVKSLVRAI